MAKLLGLDIGAKRTGVAETDFMQIIAQALETIETKMLFGYVDVLLKKEPYEAIIVGDPKDLKGNDSHNSELVRTTVEKLKTTFPKIPVVMVDERFTSKLAMGRLIESGMKKNKRAQKGSLDAESAAIILEGYLQGK